MAKILRSRNSRTGISRAPVRSNGKLTTRSSRPRYVALRAAHQGWAVHFPNRESDESRVETPAVKLPVMGGETRGATNSLAHRFKKNASLEGEQR